MPTDADIHDFASDPLAFFGPSRHAMHTLPLPQLAELQLAALRLRFGQLRDRLPVVRTMADEQGVHEIAGIDDAAPLLFPHTVYKSYPPSLLLNARFDQLTTWLSRLTTVDLSGVDASGCDSIDGWLDLLDTHTALRPAHSTGTSGTMSFAPHSYDDFDKLYEIMRLDVFPDPADADAHIDFVYPYFRTGRSGIARHGAAIMERIARDPDRVHTLHPGLASADVMFLAGRLRAAAARGERDRVAIPESMRKRREEFEEAQRAARSGMGRFVEELADRLRGRRIVSLGTWDVNYRMAKAGLERGIEGLFAPDSVYCWGGGSKDGSMPDDWEDAARRFAGVPRLHHVYAMAEVTALNLFCPHGRYHIEPWTVLYVLDADTGRPLPRSGVRTGRAAFFDLLADTHWGGFVSGDQVTVDWSPCACGRTSPGLEQSIGRFSERQGGDDKITCAASDEALGEALEFLNEELV